MRNPNGGLAGKLLPLAADGSQRPGGVLRVPSGHYVPRPGSKWSGTMNSRLVMARVLRERSAIGRGIFYETT
jgi:hypothetical protein